MSHRTVLSSRGWLNNFCTYRKLAAKCEIHLNEVGCKFRGLQYGLSGVHCKKYHILASSCVHNHLRIVDDSDGILTGCLGFQHSHHYDRLKHISECHVLKRHLLTRNCVNGNFYRNKNRHSGMLGPWKDTSRIQRQFSLSPKVILEASPRPLQLYLKLIRFDKPIGK